jgi:hypothetical protein
LWQIYALFENSSPESSLRRKLALKIAAPDFFDNGSSETWNGQFAHRKNPWKPTSWWRHVNRSAAWMTIIPLGDGYRFSVSAFQRFREIDAPEPAMAWPNRVAGWRRNPEGDEDRTNPNLIAIVERR